MLIQRLTWNPDYPRRSPLYVGQRGRESTLTGVAWLNESVLLLAHRDAKSIAVVELDTGKIVASHQGEYMPDLLDVRRISKGRWKAMASNCWEARYSEYTIHNVNTDWRVTLDAVVAHDDRSFCHGANYDKKTGDRILSFHTGERPRVEMGSATFPFPKPWGPRSVIQDSTTGRIFAITVSMLPSTAKYERVDTAIFEYLDIERRWSPLFKVDSMHADSGVACGNFILLNNQYSDRLELFDLSLKRPSRASISMGLSFPHAVALSDRGRVAVTNYGTSEVVIIMAKEIVSAARRSQKH